MVAHLRLTAFALALALAPVVFGACPARAADALHNSEASSGGHGGEKGAEPAKPKPPKPKPKRSDKEKNCQFDIVATLDVDGHRLTVSQDALMAIMRGVETSIDGYDLSADAARLQLKVRDREGAWFVGNMTRLGDPEEGCIRFLIGDLKQLRGEPPLF